MIHPYAAKSIAPPGRFLSGQVLGPRASQTHQLEKWVHVNVPGPRAGRVLAKIPDTDTSDSIGIEKNIVISHTVDAQTDGGFYIIFRPSLDEAVIIAQIGAAEDTTVPPTFLVNKQVYPIPGLVPFVADIEEFKWVGCCFSIAFTGDFDSTSGMIEGIRDEVNVKGVPLSEYNTFTTYMRHPMDRQLIQSHLNHFGNLLVPRITAAVPDDPDAVSPPHPRAMSQVGLYFSGVKQGTVMSIQMSCNFECYPRSNVMLNELTSPPAKFNLQALSAVADAHAESPVLYKGITPAAKAHHESKFMRFIHGLGKHISDAFKWVGGHSSEISQIGQAIGKAVS